MEPYRSLALLTGSLGLVSILIALSTDFWFVAMGPSFTFHSGLWPKGVYNKVADYIRATQSLTILASLSVLVSVIFLVLSYIPLLSLPGHGRLISSVTAFAAGLFAMVAMVVYTSERWNQPHSPQVQTFFSWSFYLGWVSTVLLLCTEPPGLAMTPCELKARPGGRSSSHRRCRQELQAPTGLPLALTPSPPETPSFVSSSIQQKFAGIWLIFLFSF
ncbi:protein NKG7 isoform X1 [Canis lupus baileyi]|uniref:protein NKG7 isoform X1 n=1 Tax=Canis lupus baileyi TaxID=143281 RepID=UPI003B970BB9